MTVKNRIRKSHLTAGCGGQRNIMDNHSISGAEQAVGNSRTHITTAPHQDAQNSLHVYFHSIHKKLETANAMMVPSVRRKASPLKRIAPQ